MPRKPKLYGVLTTVTYDPSYLPEGLGPRMGVNGAAILAHHGGRVVGVALYAREDSCLRLEWVQVQPEQRNLGVGTLLGRRVIAAAQRCGAQAVLAERHTGSERYLHALGFSLSSEGDMVRELR